MAARLAGGPGVRVLNDVVLNQVLVRFDGGADDADGSAGDARTRAVIDGVQRDGTCWLGGTVWHGRAAMRVSVSGWRTTEDDIDRSAAAILRVLEAVDAAPADAPAAAATTSEALARGLLPHAGVEVGGEPGRHGVDPVDLHPAGERADRLAVARCRCRRACRRPR